MLYMKKTGYSRVTYGYTMMFLLSIMHMDDDKCNEVRKRLFHAIALKDCNFDE